MSVTADAKDAMRTGDVGIRDYGDRALLLECDSTAEVLAWTETLRTPEMTTELSAPGPALAQVPALAFRKSQSERYPLPLPALVPERVMVLVISLLAKA